MSSWASISPAELGRRGEWVAALWLRLHGYRIVARNARVGGCEVDIVASRGRTLVVCEVKTRRTAWRGTAIEAVDAHKEWRLVHAGELLLQRHPQMHRLRFDVIAIDGRRLRHFRNAFS